MTESRIRSTADRTDALFDRYTLPKIALIVILLASLIGTWLTTTLNGRIGIAFVVVKWGYFVTLGVLTGGLVWKHGFVRPADLGDGAAEYCAEMYHRFDRIAAAGIAVSVVSGVAVLREYLAVFGPSPLLYGYGVLVGAWLLLLVVTTRRSAPVERQFRSPAGLATLGLALAVVVVTALAEVAVSGSDIVAASVRILHLLAFALWIGGAVWNIFVAVPTGQNRPTIAVVQAAGQQLERFRWAVRFIIPTLFATGLYQAVAVFGASIDAYLGTVLGLAVLAKIGCIGLLVVIFKLCPMWRACSPIEGVCELDDLGGDSASETARSDDDPAESGPEVTGDD